MKTNHLFLFGLLLLAAQLQGQGIFDANIHTAIPFGDVNSPVNETAQQIIDQDPNTKFLDFNILDGMGFDVDLLGVAHVATSLAIVTANDAPERDPTDYEIFGSNDGTSYTSIATGTIPCVLERFLSRIFFFDNSTAYSYYRINFTGTCNPSAIIQVADVQIFTTIGNAPTLDCPEVISINNFSGLCEGLATFDVSANDAEDGALDVTQLLGLPSGSNFPVGTTPVIFSATDSDGNSLSCEFNVEVADVEAPMIECSGDITVTIPVGDTEAMVEYDVFYSLDNCSNINPIEGYTPLGTIDGHSYYLSDTAMVISEALIHSINNGTGILGTIRSAEDNAYLLNAIQGAGYIGQLIIGYNDINSEGEFEWFSADPATYSNWNLGEPNNAGAGGNPENYTIMLPSGFWNDVDSDPTLVYPYLLEVDFALQQTEGLASGEAFPLGVTTNSFIISDAAGNSNSCDFTITVNDATAVEDHMLNEGIQLFPNPVNSQLTISNTSSIEMLAIELFDVHGKMILSNTSVDAQSVNLDLEGLTKGVYFAVIKSENGEVRRKIMKE